MIIFLILLLVFTVYYNNNRVKLDWGKYYDDCIYVNKIEHASRHRNMAEMQQLTVEHMARKRHSIRIYDLPLKRKNALVCKAVIESFRMNKQLMLILSFLLIFAALLHRTSIFNSIPLIGEPNIARIIGMLSMGTFWANMRELYSKQILSICDKHNKGFFIPFKITNIVFSYAVVCCAVTIPITVILCLIFDPGLVRSLFLIALINFIMAISFYLQSRKRITRLVTIITNLILFAGSGLLY
jgi:hypothetical protein